MSEIMEITNIIQLLLASTQLDVPVVNVQQLPLLQHTMVESSMLL